MTLNKNQKEDLKCLRCKLQTTTAEIVNIRFKSFHSAD